jgi:hypothetical protein
MITLVMAVETFLASRAADFTPWGTWAWRQSAIAAREKTRGCKVLCFGDSLVKLGVLPAVIEQRLGQRAYNLSICAAQAPASYFMLRRAIDAGARPSAVIVDYKPNMLAGGPRDFARNWPELLTLGECLELSWTAHDSTFFASTALGLLFPSVRARHDIRVNVLLALQGKAGHLRESTREYDRNWTDNSGGQATAKNPLYRGDIDPQLQRKLLSHVFWCNRVNKTYIRRFVELAGRHEIPVFWLLPPIAPVVQLEREHSGADAGYEKFIREVQVHFPNLLVIDGRHSGYDHRVMIDPVHLDREGACTLSADVADIVGHCERSTPSSPRWINLPAFREIPTEIALKEIVDFNVAMQPQSGRSRQ